MSAPKASLRSFQAGGGRVWSAAEFHRCISSEATRTASAISDSQRAVFEEYGVRGAGAASDRVPGMQLDGLR